MVPSIFEGFERLTPYLDSEFDVNFMGARIRKSFEAKIEERHIYASGRSSLLNATDPRLPSPESEDFIEWIDLLEAIDRAHKSFVMIEAGAGYGRWLVNAACAVKNLRPKRTLDLKLIGIEADRERFSFMHQHFIDNGLNPQNHRLIHAGLAKREGTFFQMRHPDQRFVYGDQVVECKELEEQVGDRKHIQIKSHDGKMMGYAVPCLPLSLVLKDYVAVDFLDCDIQGAELEIVTESAALINERVKLAHFATHGIEIEEGLRSLFESLQWKKRFDFTLGEKQMTPFGEVSFVDGIQSWENPKFTHEPSTN